MLTPALGFRRRLRFSAEPLHFDCRQQSEERICEHQAPTAKDAIRCKSQMADENSVDPHA